MVSYITLALQFVTLTLVNSSGILTPRGVSPGVVPCSLLLASRFAPFHLNRFRSSQPFACLFVSFLPGFTKWLLLCHRGNPPCLLIQMCGGFLDCANSRRKLSVYTYEFVVFESQSRHY